MTSTAWVVITGANSGLGRATAMALAQLDYPLILACRNTGAAADLATLIKTNQPTAQVEPVAIDLSDLTSVARAARTITAIGQVGALINNAGIMLNRGVSPQGHELTFATNHLGHYALTEWLSEALAPNTVVINVTSNLHRLTRQRNWSAPPVLQGWHAYAVSKRANLLHTLSLRAAGKDARAVHPGYVATNIQRNLALARVGNPLFGASSETAAHITVAALLADQDSHWYWHPSGWLGLRGKPANQAIPAFHKREVTQLAELSKTLIEGHNRRADTPSLSR